jgi:gas vesicle protein
MENSTIALLISGGGLAVIVLDRAMGGSWKLSGKLAEMEKGLRQAISESTKEVEEKQERSTHDFGETISALKEHIRQLEMFVRDRYVEKNDFALQMQRHNELLQMNFANITARLDRMEKKLDVRP